MSPQQTGQFTDLLYREETVPAICDSFPLKLAVIIVFGKRMGKRIADQAKFLYMIITHCVTVSSCKLTKIVLTAHIRAPATVRYPLLYFAIRSTITLFCCSCGRYSKSIWYLSGLRLSACSSENRASVYFPAANW